MLPRQNDNLEGSKKKISSFLSLFQQTCSNYKERLVVFFCSPKIKSEYIKRHQLRNFKLPNEGMSGNLILMSLIFCGMFISFTAETALAGAPASPASFCGREEEEVESTLSTTCMQGWNGLKSLICSTYSIHLSGTRVLTRSPRSSIFNLPNPQHTQSSICPILNLPNPQFPQSSICPILDRFDP